jgi:hypothetical protein
MKWHEVYRYNNWLTNKPINQYIMESVYSVTMWQKTAHIIHCHLRYVKMVMKIIWQVRAMASLEVLCGKLNDKLLSSNTKNT